MVDLRGWLTVAKPETRIHAAEWLPSFQLVKLTGQVHQRVMNPISHGYPLVYNPLEAKNHRSLGG